jgi:hypothetical protein
MHIFFFIDKNFYESFQKAPYDINSMKYINNFSRITLDVENKILSRFIFSTIYTAKHTFFITLTSVGHLYSTWMEVETKAESGWKLLEYFISS